MPQKLTEDYWNECDGIKSSFVPDLSYDVDIWDFDEVIAKIEKDVCTESYTNSSSHIVMKLTHMPTGKIVHGESTFHRYKLKKRLMIDLYLIVKGYGTSK